MFKWHYFDIIKKLSYYVTLFEFIEMLGILKIGSHLGIYSNIK